VQAAGDHQVQHQPEITLYSERYAFADPPQITDNATFHFYDRRLRRAKQKRTCQAYTVNRLRNNAGLERVNIRGDVGQLRHAASLLFS
jgi:hypothetical protein